MNAKLKLALLFLALWLSFALAASAQTVDRLDQQFVQSARIEGQTASIACASDQCTMTATFSLKKATSLLADLIPSRTDSVNIILDDGQGQAGQAKTLHYSPETREYSFPASDSLYHTAKITEIRKAIRNELRLLLTEQ